MRQSQWNRVRFYDRSDPNRRVKAGGILSPEDMKTFNKFDDLMDVVVANYKDLKRKFLVFSNGTEIAPFVDLAKKTNDSLVAAVAYATSKEIDPDDIDYMVRFKGMKLWKAQNVSEFYSDLKDMTNEAYAVRALMLKTKVQLSNLFNTYFPE